MTTYRHALLYAQRWQPHRTIWSCVHHTHECIYQQNWINLSYNIYLSNGLSQKFNRCSRQRQRPKCGLASHYVALCCWMWYIYRLVSLAISHFTIYKYKKQEELLWRCFPYMCVAAIVCDTLLSACCVLIINMIIGLSFVTCSYHIAVETNEIRLISCRVTKVRGIWHWMWIELIASSDDWFIVFVRFAFYLIAIKWTSKWRFKDFISFSMQTFMQH